MLNASRRGSAVIRDEAWGSADPHVVNCSAADSLADGERALCLSAPSFSEANSAAAASGNAARIKALMSAQEQARGGRAALSAVPGTPGSTHTTHRAEEQGINLSW